MFGDLGEIYWEYFKVMEQTIVTVNRKISNDACLIWSSKTDLVNHQFFLITKLKIEVTSNMIT